MFGAMLEPERAADAVAPKPTARDSSVSSSESALFEMSRKRRSIFKPSRDQAASPAHLRPVIDASGAYLRFADGREVIRVE
jgi:hypothetical protein